MLVIAELERTADRFEIRLQHGGAGMLGVPQIALHSLKRRSDRERGVIALARVVGRETVGAVFLVPRPP